jgi:stage V sporulation protein AF
MAFVAISSFAQQNAELGYAFKFVRVATLIFTYLLGAWGLLAGAVLLVFLLVTNVTVTDEYSYLYPLVPFRPRALFRLIFRGKKRDFKKTE